jgi:hypothetical protein
LVVVAAGLIIDAFGELRDQQEQVKEDMEVRDWFASVVQVSRGQFWNI